MGHTCLRVALEAKRVVQYDCEGHQCPFRGLCVVLFVGSLTHLYYKLGI